jgi:hypothetical protein
MQRSHIGLPSPQSSTSVKTPKDNTKGKSSKKLSHAMTKRSLQDAFNEDIHILELKEATERRAQKNAIRMKELELQEKRHAAKVKKMEMDAEIQKAQLNVLSNMANMFALGLSGVGGAGSPESGPSTQLGGSTMTESWVHSQRASTSSGDSSQSGQAHAFPGSVGCSPDSGDGGEFNFSTNDFQFLSSYKHGEGTS